MRIWHLDKHEQTAVRLTWYSDQPQQESHLSTIVYILHMPSKTAMISP